MPANQLYLVWHDLVTQQESGEPIAWDGDAHPLNDSLWLVRSELTRSGLYHSCKRQLPSGAALLVAPLDDRSASWPKFKGLKVGAQAWLRGPRRNVR